MPRLLHHISARYPRRIATTLLPAASVHEKGGVLEGSEISRILPVNDSGSAVKIRDLSTGPGFEVRRPAVLLAKSGCARRVPIIPRTSGNKWRRGLFRTNEYPNPS